MPGATVGMLLALERGGERLVDGLPLAERRPPVHRRAHQRMVEPDASLGEAHQPSRLRRPERRRAGPERPRRAEDDRRIAGLLGRRQQQRLGRHRQAADTSEEYPLDAGAHRQRVGKRRASGELVGGQRRRQLEQREWVALGGLDQAVTHVRPQPGRGSFGQQRAGGVSVQAREAKLLDAGGGERVDVVVAGGKQQHHPLGLEPPGGEGERVGRRLVQPLRIVHQADQRPLLGDLGEQAERAHRDQEAVVAVGRGEPEGALQGGRLGARKPLDVVEHGPDDLVQGGEHRGVLDRLAGALAEARQHRMGGVTEQADPTRRPAHERRPVIQAIADDRLLQGRVDQLRDRVMPDAEATHHRRLLLGRRPTRALTGAGARPPVRLVTAQPGDAEQAAATPRLAGAETIGQRQVERHDAAPGRVAGVAGRSVSHQRRPYLRVEAIGTHDEIALLRAPVGQADGHPRRVLGDPDALRPKPQDALVERGQQDGLEQAAVHHDQWRVEPGRKLLREAFPEWIAPRAAEACLGRDRAGLLDRRPDLQPPQHAHRVGPQQDAGTDLAQRRGPLEDHNSQTESAQGDRRAQPTDASPDDDDLPRPGQRSHLLDREPNMPTPRRYARARRLESAGSPVIRAAVGQQRSRRPVEAACRRGWSRRPVDATCRASSGSCRQRRLKGNGVSDLGELPGRPGLAGGRMAAGGRTIPCGLRAGHPLDRHLPAEKSERAEQQRRSPARTWIR